MHIRIFLEQRRLFIILFHLFLWDSFPAMLAFWAVYRIQLWTCLSDHSSQSRRTTIFLLKARLLERTAFVHSSMQRRNKTLWVLGNCLDTWKLFYHFFFYRKDKAKLCFGSVIYGVIPFRSWGKISTHCNIYKFIQLFLLFFLCLTYFIFFYVHIDNM